MEDRQGEVTETGEPVNDGVTGMNPLTQRPPTVLAGGDDDRAKVSETRVAELMDAPIGEVALPTRWRLERSWLPVKVRAKLARRAAQNLPVPLHAHNASQIAAYTDFEWDRIQRNYVYRVQTERRMPAPPFREEPFARTMTARQQTSLQTVLPFDRDFAPMGTPPLTTRILDRIAGPQVQKALSGLMAVLVAVSLFGNQWFLCPVMGLAALALAGAHRANMRNAIELSGTDYRALERATVAEPGPDPDSREHRLAQVATVLARRITASPAWRSAFLDTHRIQLDPAAEANQILEHAVHISQIRASLGPAPDGEGDAADRAREHRRHDELVLAAVTDSLTHRVAALYRYEAELAELNTEYLALQAVERSMAANPELEKLVRQTGNDELATRHLDRLTRDARDHRAAITAHLQVLTGDLNALQPMPTDTPKTITEGDDR